MKYTPSTGDVLLQGPVTTIIVDKDNINVTTFTPGFIGEELLLHQVWVERCAMPGNIMITHPVPGDRVIFEEDPAIVTVTGYYHNAGSPSVEWRMNNMDGPLPIIASLDKFKEALARMVTHGGVFLPAWRPEPQPEPPDETKNLPYPLDGFIQSGASFMSAEGLGRIQKVTSERVAWDFHGKEGLNYDCIEKREIFVSSLLELVNARKAVLIPRAVGGTTEVEWNEDGTIKLLISRGSNLTPAKSAVES